MNARNRLYLGLAVAAAGCVVAVLLGRGGGAADDEAAGPPDPPVPGGTIHFVSPRLVANDTSQPLLVFGEGFEEGVRLQVDGLSMPLDTTLIDDRHLSAILGAGDVSLAAHKTFKRLRVGIVGQPDGPASHIDVVNNTDFPVPYALEISEDGGKIFVASPMTDEVLVVDRAGGAVLRVPVGDGPRSLARWGKKLIVGHRYEPTLHVIEMANPEAHQRILPVPGAAERIAVHGDSVFVTSSVTDRLYEVDLNSGATRSSWRMGINPQALAVGDGVVAIGSRSTGEIMLLLGGKDRVTVAPDPRTRIHGGRTEKFTEFVMGGSYPRALLVRGDLVYVASIGPNVGPNPDKMEVSMNGGVGVIDVTTGKFTDHVSLGEGIPQALAAWPGQKLIFAADISRSRVVALSEGKPPKVLGAVSLPAPPGGPALGVVAPYAAGPWDLRLTDEGKTLFVLERFTGRVTEVDVSEAASGKLTVKGSIAVSDPGRQAQRRFGEILFFTDVGRTGMSCDACHPEGHTGGILFTKGDPMHIYRVPSLRSARETAPYFTPAMFPSLEFTAQRVLGRNRFHTPDPTPRESRALGLYQASLTAPRSPWRSRRNGGLPTRLELPDGRVGGPPNGMKLFFGKADCARCHPAPQYTSDQSADTRGRRHDIGTAVALSLRPKMQRSDRYDLPAPSLVGIWDQWPLLHGGIAGFTAEEGSAKATHPFALARVFDLDTKGRHGAWSTLTQSERSDLLAFLLLL